MKKRWFLLALSIVVSGLFLLGVAYATAEESPHHQIKVGKTGAMRLDQETRIGEIVLPPGEYRFVHRVEGGDHYVHFSKAKRTGHDVHPGEVRCQLEALSKKASQTAITTMDEGGTRRITRIEVAGENVAHVF